MAAFRWLIVYVVAGFGVFGTVLPGCASRGELLSRTYTTLDLAGVDPDAAFRAAQSVSRARFGRIESDPVWRIIQTCPQPVSQPRTSLTTRFHRERGEVKVARADGRYWLCVRIVTERLDSPAWSAFAPGPDQHYVSPMESGQSLDRSRREIWTPVSRNRQLEKQLVQAIGQHF